MIRAGGEAYRSVMEHVGGIKMAKSYGAEERSIRLFGELPDAMARTNVRAVTSRAVAKCQFDIGAALVLGVVPYVAIEVLHASTAMLLILVFTVAG
jgi:ATP-binding cassette subfamily C protein